MIGTSRETGQPLVFDFMKKLLIQSKGSTLVIRNKSAPEGMAQA